MYVMGEDGNYYDASGGGQQEFQTVGYDNYGRPFSTMGAAAPIRLGPGGARPAPLMMNHNAMAPTMLRLPPPPAWRPGVAPGVDMPGEGMEQLTLEPDVNGGVFDAAHSGTIIFTARTQRAFRGERPIVLIGRSGASAQGNLIYATPGFFVGTQVVGSSLGRIPLDAFAPTAFGVRLTFHQATPGMEIKAFVQPGAPLLGADTISVLIMLLGRSVR